MPVSTITYTIKDRKNAVSRVSIHVPDDDNYTEPFSSPTEYAVYIATVIAPLIKGVITSINITKSVALPIGLPVIADVTSDVEEAATFKFLTFGRHDVNITLPTINENFILSGTRKVDESAAEVSDFWIAIAIPEELPEEWLIAASDSRGDGIITFEGGYEVFRKSRPVNR